MSNIILKAKGVKEITRQETVSYPIPPATESYCPISNRQIIDTVLEQLGKNNFELKSEFHKRDGSCNKFVGGFVIKSNNSDMDLLLGYKNSYDRSMSAAFALGAKIMICSNSVVTGEISMIRRHTGKADEIITSAISRGIEQLGNNFIQNLETQFSHMKEILVDKRAISELIGRLYLEQEIISAHQLSILKREINGESFEYGVKGTLYNLYQAVTHSLKTSHPSRWMDDHIEAHKFFTNEAGIAVLKPAEIFVPSVASNQLDLLDAIREAEEIYSVAE